MPNQTPSTNSSKTPPKRTPTPPSRRRKEERAAERRIHIARLVVAGLLALCIVVPLTRGSTTGTARAARSRLPAGWSSQLDESAEEELTPALYKVVRWLLERSTDERDLATRGFLANLELNLGLLKLVDLDQLELLRRGYGWVQVKAPYFPPSGKGGTAFLRFMFVDGRWKIDRLTRD